MISPQPQHVLCKPVHNCVHIINRGHKKVFPLPEYSAWGARLCSACTLDKISAYCIYLFHVLYTRGLLLYTKRLHCKSIRQIPQVEERSTIQATNRPVIQPTVHTGTACHMSQQQENTQRRVVVLSRTLPCTPSRTPIPPGNGMGTRTGTPTPSSTTKSRKR